MRTEISCDEEGKGSLDFYFQYRDMNTKCNSQGMAYPFFRFQIAYHIERD
jgi:hypothetical protein